MKNIFKNILIIVASSLLVVTSCHGTLKPANSESEEETSTYVPFDVPEEFDTSQKVTITFWDKNDTFEEQKLIYEKAVDDFEKLYPNVTIKLSHYADYQKIYEGVIQNLSTGTTPNICISYPDHVATYLSGKNLMVPLDELMNDSKFGLGGSELKFDGPKKEEIVTKFLNEGIINDHYYTMPFLRSSEAVYMNEDWINKLGYTIPEGFLTWDWIFEVCAKALEQKEEDQVLIPFIYKSVDNMMIQCLKQLGGEYSTPNGDIYLFEDSSGLENRYTKQILDMAVNHAAKGEFNIFAITSYPGNYLNAEECLFAVDSTAGATWMGGEGPHQSIPEESRKHFKVAVRPVPQFDVNNPYIISQGPSICLFNKTNKQEVLASWLFMQYLLTNDVQIAYSKTEGYVPSTYKAQQSNEYQNYLSRGGEDNDTYYKVKTDVSRLVIDYQDYSFITPVFNGSASLRNAAGQLIINSVRDALLTTNRPEFNDEYYTKLFANMKKLYRVTEIGNNATVVEAYPFKDFPLGSKILIFSLIALWIILLVLYLYGLVKKILEKKHLTLSQFLKNLFQRFKKNNR